MKSFTLLLLLAVVGCGTNSSNGPAQKGVAAQAKKDCVVTQTGASSLIGTYDTTDDLVDAVGAWAVMTAHDQDCTINDEVGFFNSLSAFVTVNCNKGTCEIKSIQNRGGNS